MFLHSLMLRVRPSILIKYRSYKRINKLDHFNEFGKVLPKDVLNSKIKKTKRQFDDFDEFGPVLTGNFAKKNTKTISKFVQTVSFEEEKVTEECILPSEESNPVNENKSGIESRWLEETDTNKKGLELFSSGRLPWSPPCSTETPSVLRIAHQHDQSLPSVTRILSATMSEENKAVLARWEREKIALLGEDGFRKYKVETFSRGKFLHGMLETFLESRSLPQVADIEDEVSKRHRVSISQMVENIGQPLAIESSVSNIKLGYSGIVDCVAVINNTLTLIDWKTSEKVKNNVRSLYDNPLQLAAYIGAINQDSRYDSLGNITNGAVVVVYNSGYPAMIHTFTERQLEHYWNLWCERLHQYKLMS